MDKPLIVITGPTASGKTRRAVDLARAIDGEIISADSRQIYRGMDIGTGKDIGEYGDVPVHLVDICPAGYKYNLYEFLRDFRQAADAIEARGRRVILCGGTGLYVESVLKGLKSAGGARESGTQEVARRENACGADGDSRLYENASQCH